MPTHRQHDTGDVAVNREAIRRYTNQPDTLPPKLRQAIEASWGGAPVQLYALSDLDASMKFARIWVALGPDKVAVCREGEAGAEPEIRAFERAAVKKVRESPGLSCTTLTLLGEPGEPAHAIFRHTHRQRRAMENIKYILEQQIDGNKLDPDKPDEVYAEAVASPIRDAQNSISTSGANFTVIVRLMRYLLPYRTQMIFGMIAATAMTLLTLIPPLLTQVIIDDAIAPFQDGQLDRSEALSMGFWIIGAMAAVWLLREAALWVRLRTMSILGEFIARDLRSELYEHLQTLSMSFYSKKQTGSIISRVSSDTDRLWDFVAFGIIEVSLALIMLVGLSGVLIYLDVWLGLLMVVPTPLLMFLIYAHSQTMKRMFVRAWRKWSGLTEILGDTIPGMRVVKAFNQETRETKRFIGQNDNCLHDFNQLHLIWTRFWPVMILMMHTLTILVWVFAMPRLVTPAGEAGYMSIGTMMAFLLYLGMFFQPIETIGMMTRMMNRATSSAMRIFEILDTKPDLLDKEDPTRLEPVQGDVTFDNIVFAYDGIRQVVRGVSFDVKAGEMIGLVGPSGSGKTTVINLIARFYDPTGGKITIDGHDLRDLDAGHYRRQIGMVLQDPHLFHGTVLENIRYGRQQASLEQVVEAAKAANAHDFICKLPNGYETMVGERGHTLSGGERQRVSIARAILNDPRILILDEATSSVDTETERKIQEALERLVKGRTVFAIAHRLSTLRQANRLFVMKDGKLVEEGTHADLLKLEDGVYRNLHQLQHELHEMYAV